MPEIRASFPPSVLSTRRRACLAAGAALALGLCAATGARASGPGSTESGSSLQNAAVASAAPSARAATPPRHEPRSETPAVTSRPSTPPRELPAT